MKEEQPISIFYKTAKEKAAEWNISLRHLQYLCKNEKIAGAIKRAGAWFIPDDAPIPVQYTKSDGGKLHFVGTKKKIFDCALDLIKSRGFEAVSIKDIADTVGITQSSMYNHFKSKQEILDTAYDFYRQHYLTDRPTLEELEPVLQNGTLVDIFTSMTYRFHGDYIKQMTDITAILFYRCAIDERAREMTKTLVVDEGARFAKSVFDRAVQIGRLAPVDTYTMAVFINSVKVYLLHMWLVTSPEDFLESKKDELRMYEYAARLLKDLKSSTESRD